MIINSWDDGNAEVSNEGQKESGGAKKALFIGVPVIVGVLVLFFVFRSFGSNPKDMFFNSYKNELTERTNFISEILETDAFRKMQDESYESNSIFKPTVIVEGDGMPAELDQFIDLINQLSLTLDFKDNKNESLEKMAFNAFLDGESMFEGEHIENFSGDTASFIRSPQLYDKYLASKELTSIPTGDLYKVFDHFGDAIGKVYDNFYDHFYNFVLDEEFSLDKNVSTSVAGIEIKADRVSLNLSKERLEKLLEEIADKLKNDQKLHADIIEALVDYFDYISLELAEEEIRFGVTFVLEGIADIISDFNVEKGLSTSIYMDSKGEMIRQKISFGMGYDSEKFNVEIENGNYRTKDNYFEGVFNFFIRNNDDSVEIEYKREGTPDSGKDDVVNYDISGKIRTLADGYDLAEVILDMNAQERLEANGNEVFEVKDGNVKVSANLMFGMQELASLNFKEMRLETWEQDLEKGYQADFAVAFESEAGGMLGVPSVDFALSAGLNVKRDARHEVFEDEAILEAIVNIKDPQQLNQDIKVTLGLDIESKLDTTVVPEIYVPQSGEYESLDQMTEAQQIEFQGTILSNLEVLMQENPLFKAAGELVESMFMSSLGGNHGGFEQEFYFDDDWSNDETFEFNIDSSDFDF